MSEFDNKKELPATLSGANVSEEFDRLMSSRIHPETRMQCKVCWYIYDPEEGCLKLGSIQVRHLPIFRTLGVAPTVVTQSRHFCQLMTISAKRANTLFFP